VTVTGANVEVVVNAGAAIGATGETAADVVIETAGIARPRCANPRGSQRNASNGLRTK
jgi:hypothetical protein